VFVYRKLNMFCAEQYEKHLTTKGTKSTKVKSNALAKIIGTDEQYASNPPRFAPIWASGEFARPEGSWHRISSVSTHYAWQVFLFFVSFVLFVVHGFSAFNLRQSA